MKLTQAIVRDLLTYDIWTGLFAWKHRSQDYFPTYKSFRQWNGAWEGKPALTAIDKKGYKVGSVFNKDVKAHRIAWLYIYGYWPHQVDHNDGNKSNNCIFNLRDVSNLVNHQNMGIQQNNTSGVTGVNWSKKDKRWIARINVDGKYVRIGAFVDFDKAVEARKFAELSFDFHANHGNRVRNG